MDAADLMFAGISEQARMVQAGEVSPTELVGACLERIETLDPRLNAFRIVLAEKALAEAAQAEGRRGAGDEHPLLGVASGAPMSAEPLAEKLTIAVAFNRLPDAAPWPKLDPEIRAATLRMAETLRSLGHTVIERDVKYPASAFPHFLARYLKEIQTDVDTMPHPERLESARAGCTGSASGGRTAAWPPTGAGRRSCATRSGAASAGPTS